MPDQDMMFSLWDFPRNATSRCWIRWCFCLSVLKACGSIWSTNQTPTWLHRWRKSGLKYYCWDVNKASKVKRKLKDCYKGCSIEYLTFFDARKISSTNHCNLQLYSALFNVRYTVVYLYHNISSLGWVFLGENHLLL